MMAALGPGPVIAAHFLAGSGQYWSQQPVRQQQEDEVVPLSIVPDLPLLSTGNTTNNISNDSRD